AIEKWAVPDGPSPSASGRDGIRFRLLRSCPAKRIKRAMTGLAQWQSRVQPPDAGNFSGESGFVSFVEGLMGVATDFHNVAAQIPHIG
ncbi:hypothetical protein, partial [Ralstonia pseudosolanacearum]|uniref:hypothetical protein n=1 Tax=Ralstonia pseudosolanacearum TaxID=1310165 RepID=UPI003CF08D28